MKLQNNNNIPRIENPDISGLLNWTLQDGYLFW